MDWSSLFVVELIKKTLDFASLNSKSDLCEN